MNRGKAILPFLLLLTLSLACVRVTPTPALLPTSESSPSPVLNPRPGASLRPLPTSLAIPIPPDRDLYSLAQRLVLKSTEPVPRVVNPDPSHLQEGHSKRFTITDLVGLNTRTAAATLRVVSDSAYWYVEDGLNVSTDALRRAARSFEDSIYPSIKRQFGDFWNPGVDNDPRLVVLHASIPGVAGYYSSVDEYPVAIHAKSNEHEMIYMDGRNLPPGSLPYLTTLTHELQHAVHWNADPSEESWVNEGLSEVAAALAGYQPSFIAPFLERPDTPLTLWPDNPRVTAPHYGAASLFFFYLAQHYGSYENLVHLVEEPADGIDGVNAYLSRLGYKETFFDVFKDWTVANYLNAPEGAYSYSDRDVGVQATRYITNYREMQGTVPQFGTEYVRLRLPEGDATIVFEGALQAQIFPASVHGGDYCWWSNRGDSINSTLTRGFDLSSLDSATLQFWAWHHIEESWDYAYVEVSVDGGQTWDILQGRHTTAANPMGNSYGHGYTGRSDGWLQETMDMTPYAGKRVLIRFEYVTDDAVNTVGLCIDDISIPELAYSYGAEADDGWDAQGFVRTDNVLPQSYMVQLIEMADTPNVRQVVLDADQRGQITIGGFGSRIEDAVLAISPVTRHTSQDAPYKIIVRPGR